MDEAAARELISRAVLVGRGDRAGTATWADIGSGDGTFTRALAALLGPDARIYAVDRDARALAQLAAWAPTTSAEVIPVRGDFTRPIRLPGLDGRGLDGILLANALHFVPDPGRVLSRLLEHLRPEGAVVVVEYDRRAADPWVPYPIPVAAMASLAAEVGLSGPAITATRPSAFGGSLYVAVALRSESARARPDAG